jgi:hypothetical protein
VVAFGGYTPVAQAFNFGDMMNPGRWMGGGRDDDDYYDEGPYGPYGGGPWGGGPYGGPGWGAPGWGGSPYGGYGGYGAPGYGYGAPGYGVPGYGAPGAVGAPAPAPAPAAPARSGSAGSSEIDALKRRIEELESSQKKTQPPPAADWPSAPAFRPMNQY